MHKSDFQELVRRFESEERNQYQKPQEVMQHLESIFRNHSKEAPAFAGGWQGLKVADLGAGTGYFSFRMVKQGASVIALDIDERFLDYIRARPEYQDYKDRLETRKVEAQSIGLKPAEVNVIFSVNVYHHIDDRIDYFREARMGLSEQGMLIIIDFKQGEMPVGPPENIKLPEDQVVRELQDAGFDVSVDHMLEYQNIYLAVKR